MTLDGQPDRKMSFFTRSMVRCLLLDSHNMMRIDNFDRVKNQDLISLQERSKFPDH